MSSARTTPSPDMVVCTRGLTKRYGAVEAVVNLDLNVRHGEVYAFLGRNGAGKTTTIRMLLGLVRPTAGAVTIWGTAITPGSSAVFARVGYLVETATAYPNLTVCENLDIQRRLTGAPRTAVADVLQRLDLVKLGDRRAGQLSLGNKQRLALARTLLHRPDLLILDEPANGLDPAGIVEIRKLLRRLADEDGVTIFMSSHILAEVVHLADRIGIVHAGHLIQELSFDDLRSKLRQRLDVAVNDPARAALLLTAHLGIREIEQAPDGVLRIFDAQERSADIARVLVQAGLDLTRLAPVQEELEAYFLRLTDGEA